MYENVDSRFRNMVDLALKNETYELECSFKEKYHVFNNIKKSCDEKFEQKTRGPSKTLDIGFKNNVRVTLSDVTKISAFCRTGVLHEADVDVVIQKQKIDKDRDTFEESRGDVRFRLRDEKNVLVKDLSELKINITEKHQHLKSRRSYTTQRGHRIDLTLVKSATKKPGESFIKPIKFVLEEPNTCEVELEFMRSKDANDNEGLVDDYMTTLRQLLEIRYDVPDWIPVERQNSIDIQLASLVGSRFQVPIVKTLESPDVSTLNVENYCVTPKADGERVVLFTDKNGAMYLTMPRRESPSSKRIWFNTGITLPSLKESLLDAEYIKPSKLEKGLILVFDAFFVQGVDVREKMLRERTQTYEERIESVAKPMDINISVKKHIPLKEAEHLFDSDGKLTSLNYAVDGLILTPKNEPIPTSKDIAAQDNLPTRIVQSTWKTLFKWKPKETFDFVVKFKGFKYTTNEGMVQAMTLCTSKMGYEPGPYYVQKDLDQIIIPDNDYKKLRPFIPPGESIDFPIAHANVHGSSVVCKNNDVVQDGAVVECALENRKWVLLNVRFDKQSPNAYLTALSGWRNVMYPIKLDAVLGKVRMEQKALDTYWRMDESRSTGSDMENMRMYHRRIKDWLYDTASKRNARKTQKPRNLSLLELACGKAGDMSSWLAHGYSFVVGVDYYADSIGNRQNGALVRWKQKLESRYNKTRVMYFLVGDCSKKLSDGSAAANTDTYHKKLFQSLWNENKTKKFDLISIQFAIHYFFESEDKLTGLIDNINENSKPGTIFVATCFDAEKVREFIKSGAKSSKWSITPKSASNQSQSQSQFGNKITVFIPSINQHIDEYLVNGDFLDKELKSMGFEQIPVGCKSFEEFETLILPRRPSDSKGTYNMMSNDERALSSLYRSFMYVKTAK